MKPITKQEFVERFVPRLHAAPPPEVLDHSLPAIRSDDDLNGGLIQVPGVKSRAAAVLVALVERGGELHVLLTRRSDALPTHPGQIAFPGGKIDATDPGPVECALRETHEETGVAPQFVDPVGFLDVYQTRTGFRVVPVVAFLKPGYALVPEAGEVTAIFDAPLAHFMDTANHLRHSRQWQGATRYFYAMPYGDHYVWGATAGMLKNLHDRVYGP